MKFGKNLIGIAGILIFVLIILNVNFTKVMEILRSANFSEYFISLLLLVLLIGLKGLRWQLILKSQGVALDIVQSIRLYCLGFFLSSITPGKIGDFARAFYIREKAGLPRALSSVFLDRLMDVIALGILCIFSVLLISKQYGIETINVQILALLFAGGMAVFYFAVRGKTVNALLRKLFLFFVPEKLKKRFSSGFSGFFDSIYVIRKKPVIFCSAGALTVIMWTIAGLIFYFISASLFTGHSVLFMLAIYPIVTIADLLPISFSGIGTREAILVFFFNLSGSNAETAVAFSILLFFTGYFIPALLGFVIFSSDNRLALALEEYKK